MIMETIKGFIKKDRGLNNTEKSVLLTMFSHVEINEDDYKLEEIFDKLIEKTIKSEEND